MSESGLRHLAIVADGAIDRADSGARAIEDAIDRAAANATEAFSLLPALEAFSFVAPEIDRRLSDPALAAAAARACARAGRALAGAAAGLDAALRLCGRLEGLSEGLLSLAAPAPRGSGRTLLWFLRYSSRDEIARAAARFMRERPGEHLADGELDAWLDTAGVPDPDLVILAGGELEPKDALLWQASYAEIWHTPTPWTGFGPGQLRGAIAGYRDRQRRFGK